MIWKMLCNNLYVSYFVHKPNSSEANYINIHILNVFKYIFNIQLILKLWSDLLMNKPKLLEQKIVKCKILPKFEKKFIL